MPKFLVSALLLLTSVTLSGCSAFYPNWGATSLPEEPTASVSETTSASPEATQSATETATPEPTTSETQAEAVAKTQTAVEIIFAMADQDAGVLTVVAQLPDLVESGGKCTMKFIGGSVEKTLEVAAEISSSYTQCFPIELPLSDLPSGNGVVTVSYESDTHVGLSAGASVVIQ